VVEELTAFQEGLFSMGLVS